MSIRPLFTILAIAAASFAFACEKSADNAGAQASGRCPHEIKTEKCPFCNESLIASEGFCGDHAVAEALCATCRPYLKAAFRAQGDWCAEHALPESQCLTCNPDLKEHITPGVHGGTIPAGFTGAGAPADACDHGIDQARCPFCTPALIESEGFCAGHGVAEALCVKCRPYLEAAFRAEGDWCGAHGTPESQCATCNPELNSTPDGQG
jgi:cobalt-zinc-cadmium efflux system membrane fusion protein